MFVENGEETLVHLRKGDAPLIVSVDDESYARLLNEGYELVEEIMYHTRLPLNSESGFYDPDSKVTND